MDIIGVLLHVFEDTATISKSEMSARKDLFVVAVQILPVAWATGPLSLVVDYVRHDQVRLEPIRYRGEIEIIGTNPEDRPPPADLVVFHHPVQVIKKVLFSGQHPLPETGRTTFTGEDERVRSEFCPLSCRRNLRLRVL